MTERFKSERQAVVINAYWGTNFTAEELDEWPEVDIQRVLATIEVMSGG